MKIEHLIPDFWDKNNISIPQPYQIYRVHVGGSRYYFTWEDKNFDPRIYMSVTSILSKFLATPPSLIKWYAINGLEWCERYKNEAALYGTFMHSQYLKFVLEKVYKFENINKDINAYLEANRIKPNQDCILFERNDTFENIFRDMIKSDICSFMQFCIDVNLQPIAMEVVLKSNKGYAGAIDMVAYMDIDVKGHHGETYKSGDKKGLPKETTIKKRVLAIIDYKSGRKGFYESHEWQLKMYQDMWNENFPEFKVEYIFNFAPNTWTGDIPTYKLKDQTGLIDDEEISLFISLSNKRYQGKIPNVKIIDDNAVVEFKQPVFNNDSIVKRKKVIDIIREKFDAKEIFQPEFDMEEESIDDLF